MGNHNLCAIGGHVSSCGCLMREVAAKNAAINNRKADGVASFNMVYRNYKYRAQRKGYAFDLSEDDFRTITQAPCRYCGIEPKQSWNTNNQRTSGDYVHNGIDRIDNTQGYTKRNVVPCCKVCNRAKGDMLIEEYIEWILRITIHLKLS